MVFGDFDSCGLALVTKQHYLWGHRKDEVFFQFMLWFERDLAHVFFSLEKEA